eukprot:TRINITY_DN403_c0_g1_i1.p1 TRINITY_DN403_c0_g1~~TRINITY_DN403_c0_g1_i1.p1  ORF type:complete len:647 (+),score=138.88 TRINITY_DN403_c0_g1_i1:65-2005(+)
MDEPEVDVHHELSPRGVGELEGDVHTNNGVLNSNSDVLRLAKGEDSERELTKVTKASKSKDGKKSIMRFLSRSKKNLDSTSGSELVARPKELVPAPQWEERRKGSMTERKGSMTERKGSMTDRGGVRSVTYHADSGYASQDNSHASDGEGGNVFLRERVCTMPPLRITPQVKIADAGLESVKQRARFGSTPEPVVSSHRFGAVSSVSTPTFTVGNGDRASTLPSGPRISPRRTVDDDSDVCSDSPSPPESPALKPVSTIRRQRSNSLDAGSNHEFKRYGGGNAGMRGTYSGHSSGNEKEEKGEKGEKEGSEKKHRYRKFYKLFGVSDQVVVKECSCALLKGALLSQGEMYLSDRNVHFYCRVLHKKTLVAIPYNDIVSVKKRWTLMVPNAIQIQTARKKYFFASFIHRDHVYKLLVEQWEKAVLSKPGGADRWDSLQHHEKSEVLSEEESDDDDDDDDDDSSSIGEPSDDELIGTASVLMSGSSEEDSVLCSVPKSASLPSLSSQSPAGSPKGKRKSVDRKPSRRARLRSLSERVLPGVGQAISKSPLIVRVLLMGCITFLVITLTLSWRLGTTQTEAENWKTYSQTLEQRLEVLEERMGASGDGVGAGVGVGAGEREVILTAELEELQTQLRVMGEKMKALDMPD